MIADMLPKVTYVWQNRGIEVYVSGKWWLALGRMHNKFMNLIIRQANRQMQGLWKQINNPICQLLVRVVSCQTHYWFYRTICMEVDANIGLICICCDRSSFKLCNMWTKLSKICDLSSFYASENICLHIFLCGHVFRIDWNMIYWR